MKRYFVLVIGLFFTINLSAQQLHVGLYYAGLRPNYNTPLFKKKMKGGGALGGKIAVGTDHVQLGIESENALSFESFLGEVSDTAYQIDNTFNGVFIRANFGSIPAYRLGFVTKIGVGFFEDELTEEIINQDNITVSYPDKMIGVNAGIGVSGPIKKRFHWEFMYQVSYHQRPELVIAELTIPKHNAWQNAFQFGISMNFIWGKTKQEAETMISGRGW